MEEEYVIALDLSLSNSGVCIFEKSGKPVEVCSISTSPKQSRGERLKTIADRLYELKNKYKIIAVATESSFSRFNASTQAIYMTQGISAYVFWDIEQFS